MSILSTPPAPIAKLLEAINSKITSDFLSPFTNEASLIDEGKNHDGKAEIEKWYTYAITDHKATIEVKKITDLSTNIVVHILMDGDFEADYGITDPINLYFSFVLDKNSITSLSITDWDSAKPTMNAVMAIKGSFIDDPVASLRIGKRPQVETPEGWLKVKMQAVGLNYHDVFTMRGLMERSILPMIIGCEGAGVLEDGTEVLLYPIMCEPEWYNQENIDPSRYVFSEDVNGTLAEYVNAPKRNVIVRPKGMDSITASMLGVTWLTAYRMLVTKSGLRPGQTMLVQGCSGGVTSALIQLGVALGMRVWATGRTAEKRELGLRLGAEKVFAAGEELPVKADAVFDTSGEVTWVHSLNSVRNGGTVVTCGAHAGMSALTDLFKVFVNEITITGVYVGTLQEFKDLIALVAAKEIKPHIGLVVPIKKADVAFQTMVDGKTNGKIVVTI